MKSKHYALFRAAKALPPPLYCGLPLVLLEPSHPEVPATILHQLPHGFVPRLFEHLADMELVSSSTTPDEVTRYLRAACGDLQPSLSAQPLQRPRLRRLK